MNLQVFVDLITHRRQVLGMVWCHHYSGMWDDRLCCAVLCCATECGQDERRDGAAIQGQGRVPQHAQAHHGAADCSSDEVCQCLGEWPLPDCTDSMLTCLSVPALFFELNGMAGIAKRWSVCAFP